MLVTALSLASFVSYILLYTAYSKASKQLEFGLLLDVFLLRKGIDHTLVELNKALSLAGLTLLCVAFLPGFEASRYELLWSAMLQLWVHSVYSIYKFYGDKHIPVLSTWPNMLKELANPEPKEMLVGIKKVSIILGTLGQLVLSAGYLKWISSAALCYGALSLGIAHFYSMEIDFRWKLQVRPYALLPFPLAAAGLLYYAAAGR